MTNTFKIILFPVGAVAGGIFAIALKHWEILSKDFDGRWIGVGVAFSGLILGHYIDNKLECARIARELEAEGIEIVNLKSETDSLGRLLLSQSGATRFSSIYSVVVLALCWAPALFILLTPLRDVSLVGVRLSFQIMSTL